MHQEAAEAPLAVERMLAANASAVARLAADLRKKAPRAVVTCARGSSDHAATYAKYLIETRAGVITSSAAMSVASIYDARPDMTGVLMLAISQSGRSPDLLASVGAAREAGARVVALVNDESSPLAEIAEVTLPLHAGPEKSVAATKSFITALASVAQLVAAWTEDHELGSALTALPVQLEQAWKADWSAAEPPLLKAQSLYVLGRGVGFAAAQEAALKFKETCGLHAEAFSAAEVLHGPMALIDQHFPLLMFAQDDASCEGVLSVADLFTERGAPVLLAGAQRPGALPFVAGHPTVQPMLLIQSFYRLANDLSLARGLDPDNPPHLRKVTETV
jgi:glucosamine--fructose-6-phosphate aminotransferase (isomerizing)